MENIRKKLELTTKFIAIFIGISYALGFIIWNIYLQSLGFYPDLFQGRFILTGIIFILVTLSFLGIVLLIKTIFERILPVRIRDYSFFEFKNDFSWAIRFGGLGIIIIIFTFIFSFFIFPTIPGYFGGAKPKLISLIGNEQDITYLKNFSIKNPSTVQTELLCSAYDDSNYIIIILEDRILALKKDLYKGFVSLPNKDYDKYAGECKDTIISNLMGWRILKTDEKND
jgi:hypothetical protein